MIPADQTWKSWREGVLRGGLIPLLDYRGISAGGTECQRSGKNARNYKGLGLFYGPYCGQFR
jgi:hypothetical protein